MGTRVIGGRTQALGWGCVGVLCSWTSWFPTLMTPPQAVEAAQLAEDLKVQLEHVQAKVREIQPCVAENRAAKEKESFNLKRAQVPCHHCWGKSAALRALFRKAHSFRAPFKGSPQPLARLGEFHSPQGTVEEKLAAARALLGEVHSLRALFGGGGGVHSPQGTVR